MSGGFSVYSIYELYRSITKKRTIERHPDKTNNSNIYLHIQAGHINFLSKTLSGLFKYHRSEKRYLHCLFKKGPVTF